MPSCPRSSPRGAPVAPTGLSVLHHEQASPPTVSVRPRKGRSHCVRRGSPGRRVRVRRGSPDPAGGSDRRSPRGPCRASACRVVRSGDRSTTRGDRSTTRGRTTTRRGQANPSSLTPRPPPLIPYPSSFIRHPSPFRHSTLRSTTEPGGPHGLGHRRQFAHPPGVSRVAGDVQPARRAGRGGLRLRPRLVLHPRRQAAGLLVLRVRSAGQDVSPRDVCRVQGPPGGDRRRPRAAVRLDPPTDRRPGNPDLGVRVVRGRRHPGHRGPHRGAARRPLLPGHGRQGLPATDHRPGEDLQHPQEPGARPRGPQGRLGDRARAGGRLPGPGGRPDRQRARRAAHRARVCEAVSRAIRYAGEPAGTRC